MARGLKFGLRKERDCIFYVVKCADQISCVVIRQLIHAFVFAYAKSVYSHDMAQYCPSHFRACLVASIRSSGASQSTIKLVATNLIASGKLQEGVQLLCLIDKGLDACRYLQTYGAWEQAVWLAKSTLEFNDCSEVMKRWVDHLCSTQVNQKVKQKEQGKIINKVCTQSSQ